MELSIKNRIISYILKAVIIISAFVGVLISAISSIDAFMGGATVFMYFTIQSNIAIALVALIGCYFLFENKNYYIWSVIKLVFTVSITLTGIVFCFVLAPTMGLAAWNLANILTHVIVPVASVADFLVVSKIFNIKKKDSLYVVIPPLLYAIYAGIGYVLNWKFTKTLNYPYFFLNWGSKAGAFGISNELPFIGVVWWILILLIFLILVALLYLKIANIIKEKNVNKHFF